MAAEIGFGSSDLAVACHYVVVVGIFVRALWDPVPEHSGVAKIRVRGSHAEEVHVFLEAHLSRFCRSEGS